MTTDPQLAIDVSLISFLGALCSCFASFAGVYLAQRLTTTREERAIERRRARVRALFVGRIQNAASYFLFQAQSNLLLGRSSFRKALVPLQDLIAHTDLVLDLSPVEIVALHKALNVAQDELELYELTQDENMPAGVDPSDFYRYRVEKARILLRDTVAAFRELVGAFDITHVPSLELLRAIPDIPSPRDLAKPKTLNGP
jgi:hypothetical protein